MSKPFPENPEHTAISITYKNGRMIADEILPRVPVGKSSFKYQVYDLQEGFLVPDTLVGRKSRVNQVEFSSDEKTASTNDHALDWVVPKDDVDNAPDNYDPRTHHVEETTNLLLLDREIRTSNLVFNADSYSNDNKSMLSGSSQWSHESSKPLHVITDMLDDVIMRPNIAVFGRRTATHLRRNRSVVRAYNGTMGDDGMVPLAWLADFLELEDIYVGEARLDIARRGQSPQLARAWGNHASFLYRNKLANTQGGATFGLTAEYGQRVATETFDPDIGMRGSHRGRIGESVKELITAPDLGLFFENAVAG